MGIQETNSTAFQTDTIKGYYRLHARLYRATRWTFLFGRKRILDALNLSMLERKTILEVGCGTGHNLCKLAKYYPNMQIIGLDVSPDMLQVAAKALKRYLQRIIFIEKPYSPGDWRLPQKPDIVLFSYCLTMINPGWEDALQRAWDDLGKGGIIAVVDFHDSPFGIFRRWMGFNHVRMDGHLLPVLEEKFVPAHVKIRRVYGGLWSYFLFVGKK